MMYYPPACNELLSFSSEANSALRGSAEDVFGAADVLQQ